MEIFFFKPEKVNDDSNNGGRVISSPIINGFMPDIPQSEIDTGSIHYRKLFIIPEFKIPFLKIYALPTDAGDILQIVRGTDIDTQKDALTYTNWRGTGTLKTALLAGTIATLLVQSETAGQGYNALDLIRLSDGVNEEFVRASSVSWSGKIATITLINGSSIGNSYGVGSIVSACIKRSGVGINSVWIKETVPKDLSYKYSNKLKIGFSSDGYGSGYWEYNPITDDWSFVLGLGDSPPPPAPPTPPPPDDNIYTDPPPPPPWWPEDRRWPPHDPSDPNYPVVWDIEGCGATINQNGVVTFPPDVPCYCEATVYIITFSFAFPAPFPIKIAVRTVTSPGCSNLSIVNENGSIATGTMPINSSLDFKTTGKCCGTIVWSTNKGTITQYGLLTANCCPCGTIQITASCPECGTSVNHNITVTGDCSVLTIVNENGSPATDTILRNGTLGFKTTGNCCEAITWSVSVDAGSTLGGSTISGAGVLIAGATSCGSLKVTASCPACGTSATHYVRVTNAGQWVHVDTITYGTYSGAVGTICTCISGKTKNIYYGAHPVPPPYTCDGQGYTGWLQYHCICDYDRWGCVRYKYIYEWQC